MKYRTIVFDKETGEIYYDGKSFRDVPIDNTTKHFSFQVELYVNILRLHPFARFNIIPLGQSVLEPNLFNNLNNNQDDKK